MLKTISLKKIVSMPKLKIKNNGKIIENKKYGSDYRNLSLWRIKVTLSMK